MDEKQAVAMLAALAHALRLRIFRSLVAEGPRGVTPGTLSLVLDVQASTLSFHLKELMHAGLATQERDGRNLIYRPSFDATSALVAYLTAHCCQAASEPMTCELPARDPSEPCC